MDMFYCCGVIRGVKGYTRHMDEAHGGRSNCVLGMSSKDALAILNGEKTIADLTRRDMSYGAPKAGA